MQNDIPDHEANDLLEKVKKLLLTENILEKEALDATRIDVIHPENWEISLLVPVDGKQKAGAVRKAVEKVLFGECGVDKSCCDYFGYQKAKGAFEWYFRHPNAPESVCERLEAEMEAELGGEIGLGLPSPKGFKSKTDTVFMTLKDEYFREIESGEKTIEYRMLNQYYCDKLLSPGVEKKFVKFNRGYESGKENQMMFEIKEILIVSDRWRSIPARNEKGKPITSYTELPPRFAPAMYGISLGKRIW